MGTQRRTRRCRNQRAREQGRRAPEGERAQSVDIIGADHNNYVTGEMTFVGCWMM